MNFCFDCGEEFEDFGDCPVCGSDRIEYGEEEDESEAEEEELAYDFEDYEE